MDKKQVIPPARRLKMFPCTVLSFTRPLCSDLSVLFALRIHVVAQHSTWRLAQEVLKMLSGEALACSAECVGRLLDECQDVFQHVLAFVKRELCFWVGGEGTKTFVLAQLLGRNTIRFAHACCVHLGVPANMNCGMNKALVYARVMHKLFYKKNRG